MMTADQISNESHWMNRHVLIGLVIIAVGIVLFGAQRHFWEFRWWSSWWAILLVFMGLIRMISPGVHNGRVQSPRAGVILLSIGVWGLMSEAGLWGLDYSTSWPLLLIAVGVSTVWRALEER